MSTSPIISLADVKALAGISDTNSDAILSNLISAVEPAFANFCNRQSFVESAFTEYRNGTGSPIMVLASYPIVSVSSVEIGDSVIDQVSGPPWSTGYSYVQGSRVVQLHKKKFEMGRRNVVITGVAGFGNVIPWPADLQFAAQQWVLARYRERSRIGQGGSQSMAGQTVSYVPDAASGSPTTGIPAAAAQILRGYKNTIPENVY